METTGFVINLSDQENEALKKAAKEAGRFKKNQAEWIIKQWLKDNS